MNEVSPSRPPCARSPTGPRCRPRRRRPRSDGSPARRSRGDTRISSCSELRSNGVPVAGGLAMRGTVRGAADRAREAFSLASCSSAPDQRGEPMCSRSPSEAAEAIDAVVHSAPIETETAGLRITAASHRTVSPDSSCPWPTRPRRRRGRRRRGHPGVPRRGGGRTAGRQGARRPRRRRPDRLHAARAVRPQPTSADEYRRRRPAPAAAGPGRGRAARPGPSLEGLERARRRPRPRAWRRVARGRLRRLVLRRPRRGVGELVLERGERGLGRLDACSRRASSRWRFFDGAGGLGRRSFAGRAAVRLRLRLRLASLRGRGRAAGAVARRRGRPPRPPCAPRARREYSCQPPT